DGIDPFWQYRFQSGCEVRRPDRRAFKSICFRGYVLKREGLEPAAEGGAEVVAFEGKLYGGAEETLLIAGIVALAFVLEAVDLFVLEQSFDAVGELEFAACAGSDGFEHLEDARGEDIATDDGVLRGSLFELWFFDHVFDFEQARVFGVGGTVEDAVGRDGGAFDDLGGEDGGLGFVEGFDHLLHAGDSGVDDIVGEEDGEWLIDDDRVGLRD